MTIYYRSDCMDPPLGAFPLEYMFREPPPIPERTQLQTEDKSTAFRDRLIRSISGLDSRPPLPKTKTQSQAPQQKTSGLMDSIDL